MVADRKSAITSEVALTPAGSIGVGSAPDSVGMSQENAGPRMRHARKTCAKWFAVAGAALAAPRGECRGEAAYDTFLTSDVMVAMRDQMRLATDRAPEGSAGERVVAQNTLFVERARLARRSADYSGT